jgi:hypothetical protein
LSGDLLRWIKPALGDPLPHRHIWGQSGEFANQLDRADLAAQMRADDITEDELFHST